jgi:hypothetical protein
LLAPNEVQLAKIIVSARRTVPIQQTLHFSGVTLSLLTMPSFCSMHSGGHDQRFLRDLRLEGGSEGAASAGEEVAPAVRSTSPPGEPSDNSVEFFTPPLSSLASRNNDCSTSNASPTGIISSTLKPKGGSTGTGLLRQGP